MSTVSHYPAPNTRILPSCQFSFIHVSFCYYHCSSACLVESEFLPPFLSLFFFHCCSLFKRHKRRVISNSFRFSFPIMCTKHCFPSACLVRLLFQKTTAEQQQQQKKKKKRFLSACHDLLLKLCAVRSTGASPGLPMYNSILQYTTETPSHRLITKPLDFASTQARSKTVCLLPPALACHRYRCI